MPTSAFFIHSFFTGIDTHRLLYLDSVDSLFVLIYENLSSSPFIQFLSGFGVGVGCFGSQKDCLLKWHVWVWPQRELFYQEASSPTKEFFKLKGARMRPLTNKYIPWISGYKSLDTSPKTPPLPLSKSITRHRLFTEPTELAVLTNDFN